MAKARDLARLSFGAFARATPLAPFAALTSLIPDRPGVGKFLQGVQFGLSKRTGTPLPGAFVSGLIQRGGRSRKRLARFATKHPTLIPNISPAESDPMANLLTAAGGFGDWGGGSGGGLSGWDVLSGGLNTIAGALTQNALLKQQRKLLQAQMRGFAPAVSAMPAAQPVGWGSILGGAAAGAASALGMPSLGGLTDYLPGGLEEGGTGLFGPDLFASTAASARQRMIDAPHPTTGERVYWRPVGRPVLFSGDLQLLKRTRKTISRYCAPAGIQRARRRVRRR